MEKFLNVLGIIVAWLLSIVLVLMLIVTPIVFSALSLLNGETIAQLVSGLLTAGQEQAYSQGVQVVTLSETTQPADSAENVGKDVLSDMFGDKLTPQQISAILSSGVAKELIEAYTEDLTGAFAGGTQEAKFNAEKIKSIVENNIDDLVQVLQANIPECANMDATELKNKIMQAVDENAEKIVDTLPKPEEIKQQLTESNPELEMALMVLAKKDMIKLAFIVAIVVLSGLIFVCRIPGLRGFRWLATDLFVGGGFGAFTTVGLLVSKSALSEIATQSGEQAADVVGVILKSLTDGMLVRTLVMLASGGVLLAAYILIGKLKAKKQAPAGGLQTEDCSL